MDLVYEKGTPMTLEDRLVSPNMKNVVKVEKLGQSPSFEGIILNNIGEIYSAWGEPQKKA